MSDATSTAASTRLCVGSEVGTLRRVMLHRPGRELARLTPANKDELLFDDVLWVKRAREEHDALAERGLEGERNVDTNTRLRHERIEVIAIAGAQPGRGGGPRCV